MVIFMEFSKEKRKELIKKYGLNKTEKIERCLNGVDEFINIKNRKIQDFYNVGVFIGVVAVFSDDLPDEIRNTISELHNNISLNIEKYMW